MLPPHPTQHHLHRLHPRLVVVATKTCLVLEEEPPKPWRLVQNPISFPCFYPVSRSNDFEVLLFTWNSVFTVRAHGSKLESGILRLLLYALTGGTALTHILFRVILCPFSTPPHRDLPHDWPVRACDCYLEYGWIQLCRQECRKVCRCKSTSQVLGCNSSPISSYLWSFTDGWFIRPSPSDPTLLFLLVHNKLCIMQTTERPSSVL